MSAKLNKFGPFIVRRIERVKGKYVWGYGLTGMPPVERALAQAKANPNTSLPHKLISRQAERR